MAPMRQLNMHMDRRHTMLHTDKEAMANCKDCNGVQAK